ncbi:MAG: FHA domain-containing protein [Aquabacterium sp.]
MDANAAGFDGRRTPLALIERLDLNGRVQERAPVYGWPFRVGRSLEADFIQDDPHLAGLHATLDVVDGVPRLTLGETLNGAVIDGKPLQAHQSAVLTASQPWRMGASQWRIRLASEALAPEQPLSHPVTAELPAAPTWRRVWPLMLLSVLTQLLGRWLDNNPGTPLNSYFSMALGTVGLSMGWALFWALGHKLFQGQLAYKAHLRLALVYSLAWTAVDALLPWLGYAMDWPWLSRVTDVTSLGILCALIWAHLALIMPTHRRGLMAGLMTLYITGLGLNLWIHHQRTGQYFSQRYATTLLPPAWRLVGTQPVSSLLDDARAMKAALDQQAREDSADDANEFFPED